MNEDICLNNGYSDAIERKLNTLERKLVIYETTHFENLSALLELSEGYFSEITVFIPASYLGYCRQILSPLLLRTKINWVLQNEEGNRPFIRKFFRHISHNSYTHLHVGTLENNLLVFSCYLLMCRRMQISMTIHSINEFNSYSLLSLRGITESLAKKLLLLKVQHYRVLAPQMAARFKSLFPQTQVCFIPGNFFRMKNETKRSNTPFTIVIPGTVQHKRRDYTLVIQFLTNFISKLTEHAAIHLILAGNADNPDGKEIIRKLQSLSDYPGFQLSFFLHPVDQQEYEMLYRKADIIWAPVVVQTNSIRGVTEISGVTHSPGFITDQIHFGKPAIIPRELQVPEQLVEGNWRYENENELWDILEPLLLNKNLLKEAIQKMNVACSYFKKENFVEDFKNLMELK